MSEPTPRFSPPSHEDVRRLFEVLRDLCLDKGLGYQAHIADMGAVSLITPEDTTAIMRDKLSLMFAVMADLCRGKGYALEAHFADMGASSLSKTDGLLPHKVHGFSSE